MKCVQYVQLTDKTIGRIDRLSDEEAAKLVAFGIAKYVPKSAWKAAKAQK